MRGVNCNVSFQVIPVVPEPEIYPVVDAVLAMIRESGVKHVVGPMETTMEGELHTLLGLVEQAQEICLQRGAARVLSVVKIDYKPGGVTIDEKTAKYCLSPGGQDGSGRL